MRKDSCQHKKMLCLQLFFLLTSLFRYSWQWSKVGNIKKCLTDIIIIIMIIVNFSLYLSKQDVPTNVHIPPVFYT
jgi:hypothetical protein